MRREKEFRLGRTSIEDEHREGQPSSPLRRQTDYRSPQKSRRCRICRSKITIRYVIILTVCSVQRIFANELHMKKFFTRRVPRMLTDERNKNHQDQDIFFHDNGRDLDLQIKQRSITWNELLPWRHRNSRSQVRQESLWHPFLDAEGIIIMKYFEKEVIIKGAY